MEYLESIVEYVSGLFENVDFSSILSYIWEAIEYIISLVG